MGYVGNTPAEKYASFAVQNFSVSATANYTLDHPVANENDIRLVINNVVQHPGSGKAYTASGTTLTLSEATAGTDNTKAVTPAGLAAALTNATGYGVPCGTIITFGGQAAPTDYLKCDGAAVNRTTYKSLFNVIGTVYGAGNGKTTFNLPNLTHENAMIIHCIKA